MRSPFPGMDPYLELDYAGEAEPPLTGESASWAADLLKNAGLRSG